MKRLLLTALLACSASLAVLATPSAAAAEPAQQGHQDFAFGMISHAFAGDNGEEVLRRAITETDADNLAFVVVNGIKSSSEPCDDALYSQRREILSQAQNGVFMSLAASDWITCRDKEQRSDAIERLARMRELFHSGEFSFGASRLPLLRQSLTPKFRGYAENTRWEVGNILFATVNLPAGNNHFLLDGGRNNEFEDRLIANRNWLQHLFAYAALKKVSAVVFFSDGNPFGPPPKRSFFRTQRDGFSETRRAFSELAGKFQGRVLVVHGETGKNKNPPRILWTGNLGSVGAGERWLKVVVDDHLPQLFAVADADGERR
ncbi:hypothetical protein J8I26_14565 [Herbaspirillum sp. LeCh32-8]|uniref:hypothetical protein n=1 Tax=Herbaspirillum sp. LeCh32-8 TaxID=2821356 RepID=UPI001AE2F98C|nr:hypothetical protein [Herbaspirillum sp. LeCh32-8]MBP0599339.1 hypothetical protein [Herbaspirillum sp. LeCh32-8]